MSKIAAFFLRQNRWDDFFRSTAVRDIVGWVFLVARWLRRLLPQKWHFLQHPAPPLPRKKYWLIFFIFSPSFMASSFSLFGWCWGKGGVGWLALVVRDTRCLLRLNPSVARANNRTSRQIRKVFGRENMVFLKVVEFYPQWIFFSCVKTLEKKNHFLRNSLLSMYWQNMELRSLTQTKE